MVEQAACCMGNGRPSTEEPQLEPEMWNQDSDAALLRRLSQVPVRCSVVMAFSSTRMCFISRGLFLTQDVWPDGAPQHVAGGSLGCDSSDCVFCQGLQHGPFCSSAVSRRVCTWLGKHPYVAEIYELDGEDVNGPSSGSSVPHSAKRFKRAQSMDADSAVDALGVSHVDLSDPSYYTTSHSSREWRFQQSFRDREDPAPAQLEQVGEFHSPSRAEHANSSQLCDLICALEFSPDGRLLVAAGVSKQVRGCLQK